MARGNEVNVSSTKAGKAIDDAILAARNTGQNLGGALLGMLDGFNLDEMETASTRSVEPPSVSGSRPAPQVAGEKPAQQQPATPSQQQAQEAPRAQAEGAQRRRPAQQQAEPAQRKAPEPASPVASSPSVPASPQAQRPLEASVSEDAAPTAEQTSLPLDDASTAANANLEEIAAQSVESASRSSNEKGKKRKPRAKGGQSQERSGGRGEIKKTSTQLIAEYLAAHPNETVRKRVAEALHLSPSTVSKNWKAAVELSKTLGTAPQARPAAQSAPQPQAPQPQAQPVSQQQATQQPAPRQQAQPAPQQQAAAPFDRFLAESQAFAELVAERAASGDDVVPLDSYGLPSTPETDREELIFGIPESKFNELSNREQVDAAFDSLRKDTLRRAVADNRELRKRQQRWRAKNPNAPEEDFYRTFVVNENGEPVYPRFNFEEFSKAAGSLVQKYIPYIKRYASSESDEESVPEESDVGSGKVKDQDRLWRFFDRVQNDFKIGFFHLTSERILDLRDEKGRKTGKKYVGWNRECEREISDVCSKFGWDPANTDAQRNVFRTISEYASMSVDMHGKMFGENAENWSMTTDEFRMIGELVRKSMDLSVTLEDGTVVSGYPFWPPHMVVGHDVKLGGTPVFPTGYIPNALASAMCGPGSQCMFDNSEDLNRFATQVFSMYTKPRLEEVCYSNISPSDKGSVEEVKKNLAGQRYVIKKLLEAKTRIDGMSTEEFSKRYGIDTNLYYNIDEIRDTSIDYVVAANGRYDAAAENAEWQERLESFGASLSEKRGSEKVKDDGSVVGVVRDWYRRTPTAEAFALAAAFARNNALFLNLPIFTSAIAEHGVGNVFTNASLAVLSHNFKSDKTWELSDMLWESLWTEEAQRTIEACEVVFQIGGNEALAIFSRECVGSNKPITMEEAVRFLNERVLRRLQSKDAAKFRDLNTKMNQITRKIMAGDTFFKKGDMRNWMNATLVMYAMQSQTEGSSVATTLTLTGPEIDGIFKASGEDITRTITQLMTTQAARDGLIAMRTNNIANLNPLGQKANSLLRQHGATNALITFFFDTFPTYGINYIYNMIPFSRTMSYLNAQRKQNGLSSGDAAIVGGTVMMGNMNTDKVTLFGDSSFVNNKAFMDGLKFNLVFDMVSFGGRTLVTSAFLSGLFLVLGFDPPDDPEKIFNFGMWKIGSNFGLGADVDGDGKGDGQEIELAFWLNDLTMWGLPVAFGIAAAVRMRSASDEERAVYSQGRDWASVGANVFADCLAHQFDGNVVLDCAEVFTNFGQDIAEWQAAIDDPDGMGEVAEKPGYSVGEFLLHEAGLMRPSWADVLTALNKITPGSGIYRILVNETMWDKDKRRAAPSRVFDYDSPYEDATKAVENETEYEFRRLSASGNLFAGAVGNLLYGTYFGNGTNGKTGVFPWQQPVSFDSDPKFLVWMARWDGLRDNYAELDTEERWDLALSEIMSLRSEYATVQDANDAGMYIPGWVKYDAQCGFQSYIDELEAQRDEEVDALRDEYGWKDDRVQAAQDKWDQRISDAWDFYHVWINNDEIKTYLPGYEVLATDFTRTYTNRETGQSVNRLAAFMPWNWGKVDVKVEAKGNHPSSFLPWTNVDYENRGWSGETIPYWYREGMNLDNIPNEIIQYGRNKGVPLYDLLYGEVTDLDFSGMTDEEIKQVVDARQEFGGRLHNDPTIGARARVPVERSSELRDQDVSAQDIAELTKAIDELSKNVENGGGVSGGSGSDDYDKPSSGQVSEVERLHNMGAISDEDYQWLLDHPSRENYSNMIDEGKKNENDGNFPMNPNYKEISYFESLHDQGFISDDDYERYSNGELTAKEFNDIYQAAISASKKGDSNGGGSGKKYYRSYYSRRYSSGSGGGSSYNPKIYSSSRSINGDRAATMGTRTPYTASTKSYLRPGFVTKGSREAYERQDI